MESFLSNQETASNGGTWEGELVVTLPPIKVDYAYSLNFQPNMIHKPTCTASRIFYNYTVVFGNPFCNYSGPFTGDILGLDGALFIIAGTNRLSSNFHPQSVHVQLCGLWSSRGVHERATEPPDPQAKPQDPVRLGGTLDWPWPANQVCSPAGWGSAV